MKELIIKTQNNKQFYRKYVKPVVDIIMSIVLLTFSFIPFLIFFIWVKLDSKGKAIFVQERIGKNNKKFKMYKLKTMEDSLYNDDGSVKTRLERLTKPGKIARKLSIDEVPQLLNILKGDMSFVGPRPILARDLEYLTESEKRRHSVKPGLTGLAQVRGRAFLDWDKRFKYDLFYVNKICLKLDVIIVFQTIKTILSAEGTGIIKPNKAKNLSDLRSKRNKKN